MPAAVLMPEPEADPALMPPNAFVAFYCATPAERVASAARIVAVLERYRNEAIARITTNLRDAMPGQWWRSGCAEDIEYNEDHIRNLTHWIAWLQRRYDLSPYPDHHIPVRVHLDGERRLSFQKSRPNR